MHIRIYRVKLILEKPKGLILSSSSWLYPGRENSISTDLGWVGIVMQREGEEETEIESFG